MKKSDEDSAHPEADTFEFLATILLALAAVATAWAGFQSAKWGGVQSTSFSQAGASRTESVRASTLAGQQAAIDVTTFFTWLSALVSDIDRGDIVAPESAASYEPTAGTLSGFTFERLRPEFKPAAQAWLDTDPFLRDGAPATPFDMPQYQLQATAESERQLREAEQRAREAADANQTSDNYVMTAVLFASALFFAALASKLVAARNRAAALALAMLVFFGTTVYVFTLPIEV